MSTADPPGPPAPVGPPATASVGPPDRRTILLDAVLDLLAAGGLPAVTHRAVDRHAGLPQGSTTYYYPRKIALLDAATDRLALRLQDDCDAVLAHAEILLAAQGREATIAYLAADLAAFADDKRDLMLARLELTLAAARDPALRAAARRLAAPVWEPVAMTLRLLDGDAEEERVEACLGVLEGLVLRHVAGIGARPTVARLAAVFRSL